MSKAKKVILVIVEGPTDEDALSSVLKQIFSSAEVHFHVIYGDITTEDAITANNAKSYVAKRIAAEMKKYAYKTVFDLMYDSYIRILGISLHLQDASCCCHNINTAKTGNRQTNITP